MDFLNKLEEYFKNTPREKILEDWEVSKSYDNVGPKVEDFIADNKNRICYLVSYNYGSWEESSEIPIFVTLNKKVAEEYVNKFNRILKSYKEFMSKFERDYWIAEEYVDRFDKYLRLRQTYDAIYRETELR